MRGYGQRGQHSSRSKSFLFTHVTSRVYLAAKKSTIALHILVFHHSRNLNAPSRLTGMWSRIGRRFFLLHPPPLLPTFFYIQIFSGGWAIVNSSDETALLSIYLFLKFEVEKSFRVRTIFSRRKSITFYWQDRNKLVSYYRQNWWFFFLGQVPRQISRNYAYFAMWTHAFVMGLTRSKDMIN